MNGIVHVFALIAAVLIVALVFWVCYNAASWLLPDEISYPVAVLIVTALFIIGKLANGKRA